MPPPQKIRERVVEVLYATPLMPFTPRRLPSSVRPNSSVGLCSSNNSSIPRSILFGNWRAKPPPRLPAPAVPAQLAALSDLEKDVLANPYAAMIASPLRRCIYHERIFPNAFLTRLIRARDPITKKLWIVSRDGHENKGWWVKAKGKVLATLYKDGRQKYINDTAFFRPDMHLHIYRLHSARAIDSFRKLAESSRKCLQQQKSGLLVVMRRVLLEWEDRATWETKEAIPGLQCVVVFLPVNQPELVEGVNRKDDTMDNSRADKVIVATSALDVLPARGDVSRTCVSRFVSLRTQESETTIVPVYNARALWGDERAAEMRDVAVEGLGRVEVGTGLLVVGVMAGIQSKKFAMEMWKSRGWLD